MSKQQRRALSDLRLLCTFTVRYQLNGKRHILMPGQAFPAYHATQMCRMGPEFDIVLVSLSVDLQDELVPEVGMPAISRASYRQALRRVEQGINTENDIFTLQQANTYELGGACCIATVRPHRMPIGAGLFVDSVSTRNASLQFDEEGITLASAAPLVEKLSRHSETFLPFPRFFVDGGRAGNCLGYDVTHSCRPEMLRECLLPVCPRPLQGGSLVQMLEMASGHLHRLKAKEVWLGLELPSVPLTELPEIPRRPVSVDEVRAGSAPSPTMYSLLHRPTDDYFLPLRVETRMRIRALSQGNDAVGEEFLLISMGHNKVGFLPKNDPDMLKARLLILEAREEL